MRTWTYRGVYGYETCQTGSVHIVPAPHQIHSWCKHLVYYNSEFASYFETSNGRKKAACHELGHNLGLRHATSANHPNTYDKSCMRDGVTNSSLLDPSGSDVNHLEDYYPKP